MRPKSLVEVAAITRAGESFNLALFSFLDEFYLSPSPAFLAREPELLAPTQGQEGRVLDAYLAAVADHLSQRFGFWAPDWTDSEDRKLHRPWFAVDLASPLRAVLIQESPPAFRSRNLFVSENALARA